MNSRILRFSTLLLLATSGFAAKSKISKDLEGNAPNLRVDVIVQFRQAATSTQHRKILAKGGSLKATLDLVHAAAYRIAARKLPDLAADPDVVYISADRKVKSTLDNTAAAVNAAVAWRAGLTGAGIGVAVVDSGITAHQDLTKPGNRIGLMLDLAGGGTQDRFGHGEHVAGIIAGNGNASQCKDCTRVFSGIAPSAKVLSFRVLDGQGQGTDSDVVAAIQAAIH